MASRENLGLQISLISFVGLTVILAIACYFLWQRGEEAMENKTRADTQLAQAQTARTQAEAENKNLKLMIGYPPETQVSEVEAAFRADMAAYGLFLQQEVENYHLLASLYVPQWIDAQQSITRAETDVQTLNADVAAAREQQQSAEQSYENSLTQANDQVTAAGQSYATDLTARQQVNDEANAALTVMRGRESERIQELEAQIAVLERQLSGLGQQYDKARDQLEGYESPTLDQPDGMISFVGPDIVYINVGSADAVRRQMTFSVYESGEGNVAQSEQKGTIEVTAIRDEHLAEARIISDSLANPILPGDLIFSPIWQPGQQLHFAMIGSMDIDGDGEDDSALVRRLILLNGGAIDEGVLYDNNGDAITDASGDPVIGPLLSLETRYLVVGDPGDETSSASDLAALNAAKRDAEEKNIEQISVERLLDLMGYRGTERSIGLGDNADPDDFRPRPDTGRGSIRDFRERRPPAETGSAY